MNSLQMRVTQIETYKSTGLMAMYNTSCMIQNFGPAQILHTESVICYVFLFKWEIAGENTD